MFKTLKIIAMLLNRFKNKLKFRLQTSAGRNIFEVQKLNYQKSIWIKVLLITIQTDYTRTNWIIERFNKFYKAVRTKYKMQRAIVYHKRYCTKLQSIIRMWPSEIPQTIISWIECLRKRFLCTTLLLLDVKSCWQNTRNLCNWFIQKIISELKLYCKWQTERSITNPQELPPYATACSTL